jgi:hypothetical protein
VYKLEKLSANNLNFPVSFDDDLVLKSKINETTTTITSTTTTTTTTTTLPSQPLFLERYTSFYCHNEKDIPQPKAILSALSLALRSCENGDIKLSLNVDETSIKGTAYIRHSPVSFVLQLYQSSSDGSTSNINPGKILVECQRRSGDSFIFQKLYHQALVHLYNNNTTNNFTITELIPTNISSNQSSQMENKKTLPLILERANVISQSELSYVELDDNSCNVLINMASSDKNDVALEAIQTLTDIVTRYQQKGNDKNDDGNEKRNNSSNINTFFQNEKSTQLIIKLLASKSLEIQRCTLTICKSYDDQISLEIYEKIKEMNVNENKEDLLVLKEINDAIKVIKIKQKLYYQ